MLVRGAGVGAFLFMFVDRVQIEAVGGRGGDGCMSFRRERFIPRGGPDGGDGGNGGSVIALAQSGVNHLSALAHRKKWKAERGTHGKGANRRGRNGADHTILVPPGTVIIDAANGFVIRDLVNEGEQVVVAHGGKGGRGNATYKSSTNQAPRLWTPGAEGEQKKLIFELKVIADVGLIGKPNAGKSTLLSRLSKARPEIANYPFTTKHPNLGRVQIDYDRSFMMADIPGLIEGAHLGVGLGHEFLKHVERAGFLVHLIEPAPMDGSDPLHNYHLIREELEKYTSNLGQRPELVAVTKAELPDAAPLRDQLQKELNREVLLISAVTGQGLDVLIHRVASELSMSNEQSGQPT